MGGRRLTGRSRPAWALARATGDPDVAALVQRSREALADLQWHPALRRRASEVRAEVAVRAAASIATVRGARVPLDVVRAAYGGAQALDPAEVDPSLALALGALRAIVAMDGRVAAPLQVMARLHAAAAVGVVATADLGRPREGSADRVAALALAMSDRSADPVAAVGVLAAVCHAEVVAAGAFDPVSTEVGFALARGVVRRGGLDSMGVGLPEEHAVTDIAGYRSALAGYADDPVRWCAWWLGALVVGADHGRMAADAVARGRFD